jgi:hypothetical protein
MGSASKSRRLTSQGARGVICSRFLLQGYKDGGCKKPKAAKADDKMYEWTWKNLKALIGGGR